MTNIIKRKGLLSLVAVVVMIAMMSIACKNRATVSTSLSGTMPIDLTQDVSQFEGKTFRSENRLEGTGGVPVYLWVEISAKSTVIYGAGNEQKRTYFTETILAQGLGDNYVFSGKSSKNEDQSGSLKFDPDGTVTINFIAGTSYNGQTIKCKLVD